MHRAPTRARYEDRPCLHARRECAADVAVRGDDREAAESRLRNVAAIATAQKIFAHSGERRNAFKSGIDRAARASARKRCRRSKPKQVLTQAICAKRTI